MAVSYKKLWKLLIDKDMKKKELEEQAKVSHYTVSKMYRGENVTIDILERICKTLDCSLDDIVEFVPDEKKQISPAEKAEESLHYILKTQNPVIPRLKRSRCRSSQEITDSPTPFSALYDCLWTKPNAHQRVQYNSISARHKKALSSVHFL